MFGFAGVTNAQSASRPCALYLRSAGATLGPTCIRKTVGYRMSHLAIHRVAGAPSQRADNGRWKVYSGCGQMSGSGMANGARASLV
jgi:hypothetical protein